MKQRLEEAVAHLSKADKRLAKVILKAGPCQLRPNRDRFGMLIRSIISQQISTAAARTIRERLTTRAGALEAERLHLLTEEDYRLSGISPQKMRYIRDLVERTASGTLPLNQMGRLTDEEVILRLTEIKGIGRWTAQMFLMFSLGRMDVLPHDDLGIRNAMRKLYGLEEAPTRDQMDEIAAPWRPYATVACWYCWRSLEPTDSWTAKKVK
jgi:DNA-3-methyladenine glycosylase II